MHEWGLWEWVGYTTLSVTAVLSAVDMALKSMPDLAAKIDRSSRNARTLLGFLPLLFLVIATATLGGRAIGVIGPTSESASESEQDRQLKAQLTTTQQQLAAVTRERDLLRNGPSAGQKPTEQQQLASLIEATKRLSSSDRERLSNALFDVSELITELNTVFGAANLATAKVGTAQANGTIAKTAPEIIDNLKKR